MDRRQARPGPRIRPVSLAIVVLSSSIMCGSLPASAQIVAGVATPGAQPRPLEVVKASFARVLAVEPDERRAEIGRGTPPLFDFLGMSPRMLGGPWAGAPPREEGRC